jgi:small subunit ribosomal protein S6
MVTRNYEIVYIFDTTLEEPQINERLERFHALLKSDESPEPVQHVSHWGKRTLAYPIQHRDAGYYVVVRLVTEPPRLAEFERIIKLDEGVIRYLLVLNEGDIPSPPRDDSESKQTAQATAGSKHESETSG